MIEIKSFRVGNLVQHGSDTYIVKELREYSIEAQHTDGTSEPTTLLYVDINPIPLDEAWLERLGFVCLGKKRNWFDRGNFSINTSGVVSQLINGEWLTLNYLPKITSVHILQNFIQALTGEELTINDKK